MKTRNKTKKHITWESYFRGYEKCLREVRKETFEVFPSSAHAAILPGANSVEFYPLNKIEQEQSPHSFLGILRNHLWKITNWISFEILNGKYFEAIRDIRFLFEWVVLGVVMEDAIEEKIFEKYGWISEIGLKMDILKIFKKIPYRKREILKRDRKKRVKEIVRATRSYLRELSKKDELKKISPKEINKYIKDYARILSDEKWWNFKISEVIKKELSKKDFLQVSSYQQQKLIQTWRDLCDYAHFGVAFLEEIIIDPEYIFVEKLNKRLFKKCVKLYLTTLDLSYAAVLWRWPTKETREKVRHIIELWKKNFNISFPLTNKQLKNFQS